MVRFVVDTISGILLVSSSSTIILSSVLLSRAAKLEGLPISLGSVTPSLICFILSCVSSMS